MRHTFFVTNPPDSARHVGNAGSDQDLPAGPGVSPPGTTLFAGPRVTKQATPALPEALRRELDALRRSGFGGVGTPQSSPEGWRLRLRGLTLPGGVRTDALILLPRTYPLAAPIGFYLAEGAQAASLDQSHLYDRSYHGAPDLRAEGWRWFCGVAENWQPGRHTLVAFITVTLAFFADRALA